MVGQYTIMRVLQLSGNERAQNMDKQCVNFLRNFQHKKERKKHKA